MNKMLKRVVALFLAITLVFSSGIVAFADSNELQDSSLIPLREFFYEQGGEVEWDIENRLILASLGDFEFVLRPRSTRAYRNGTAINLNHPITISNNTAFIHNTDLLLLFGMEVDLDTPFPLTIAGIQESIPIVLDQFAIQGLTFALVDAQTGFTFTQGFGLANSHTGTQVDEHTIFSLASISKPVTAIAVMQLVEAGLIDLDEPIITYLPDFSLLPDASGFGDYNNITVRMLMSHASGIPLDFMASGVLTTGDYNPDFMDNFLELLVGEVMLTPEGTSFAYANNAFTLLGVLVAAVGTDLDSPFDGFVQYTSENIFAPLDMNNTTFELLDSHWPTTSRAYAHTGAQEDFIFFNALPTGGLMSSAYDMARFMHVVLGGGDPILSPASIAQMFVPQDFGMVGEIDSMRPMMHPGLGFVYSTGMTGFTHSGHSGNLVHFHSDMAFDLESGIGVFVSVNSISGMPVVRDIAVSFLTSAILEKTGSLNMPEADLGVSSIEVEFEALEALEGFYAQMPGDTLMQVVASEDGYLYLYGIMPDPLNLWPLSDGSFICAITYLRFWFEYEDGTIVILLGAFRTMMLGMRLDPEWIIAPEGFNEWVGTYLAYVEPGNVSVIYRIEVGVDENGFAYIRAFTLHNMEMLTMLISMGDMSMLGDSFFQDDEGTWLIVNDGRFLRVD